MRGAFVIACVLCALCVWSIEIQGCSEEWIRIESAQGFVNNSDEVKCLVQRESRSTHLFGMFLKNQDVLVSVGDSELVLRLEHGTLVDVEPRYARPSVHVECGEAVINAYLEEARWPDRYSDVRRVVSSCDVSATRLVVVPQVSALTSVVGQSQAVLDLLAADDGVWGMVGDSATILFAGPGAVLEFSAQFMGVFV